MGRKKKQKKTKNVSNATGQTTPVVSRPPSPSPGNKASGDASISGEPVQQTKQSKTEEITDLKARESNVPKDKGKGKADQTPQQEVISTIRTAQAFGTQRTLSGLYNGHINKSLDVDMKAAVWHGGGLA